MSIIRNVIGGIIAFVAWVVLLVGVAIMTDDARNSYAKMVITEFQKL